jgi:CubicO group peptidase (beta-lactamase class C family)
MMNIPRTNRRQFFIASAFGASAFALPAVSNFSDAAAVRRLSPRAQRVAAATDLFAQLDDKINAGLRKYKIPGAAVGVFYDSQEYVKGYGVTNTAHPTPVDGNTLFRIGSTSKTLTGTAAMVLVDRGELNLDAPVSRYVPGFRAPSGAESVTVRQCLNHSAGWMGYDYHDTGRGDDALAKYTADIHRLPQLTKVGTTFSYNNAAISVAGHVIEQVTKRTFEDAVQELVLDPVGMADTYYYSDAIIGYNIAAGHDVAAGNGVAPVVPSLWTLPRSMNPFGGAISTVSDQLKYARFHLGDGTGAHGKKVMSQAALQAMRSNPGPGGTLMVELDGMGVSWSIRPTAEGPKVIQHGGDVPGQHSGMLFVPERHFGMTLLTNSESGPRLVEELFVDHWALALFTGLHNLPATPQRLDASALAPYEGQYMAQQIPYEGPSVDYPAELRAEDGKLQMILGEGPDASTRTLTFYTTDYVFVNESDGNPLYLRANFLRDDQGHVEWLRLGGRLFRHSRSQVGRP